MASKKPMTRNDFLTLRNDMHSMLHRADKALDELEWDETHILTLSQDRITDLNLLIEQLHRKCHSLAQGLLETTVPRRPR